MSRIKVLDDLTIQKIAAGEIIERPSSIIKELVENSLDANSSNITIEISNGGKSYIRVTDDGDGILKSDLENAFKRHSTSKLSNIDDLYRIASFGFRGEALASIATISKVEILTKTPNSLGGIQAFVKDGKIFNQRPVGCPKGTTLIVRDLFYNVPVRKKFLKSDIAESNHISDIIYKLALGNPGVSFKYIKDNKIILRTSKNNNLISNIYSLLGNDYSNNLFDIKYCDSEFNIYGYISNNNFYRGNRTHQYLYVNNRYVKNDYISNIIENKYKSIIPINKFPIYILFIDIEPSLIDVNIHPTKEQIKFINQQQIGSIIESIVDKRLKSILAIPNTLFKYNENNKTKEELPLLYEEEFLQEQNKIQVTNIESNEKNDFININEDIEKINSNMETIDKDILQKEENNDNILFHVLNRIKPIGILFATYILAEDSETNKLHIIDQHAAHERIMYEKYLKEYKDEKVVIQNLLVPEIIELTNAETSIVMDNISVFNRMGFLVEKFGTNSVIIRGVPILFGKPEVKELFLTLVDNIKRDIESSYEVKLDKIIKIACTQAIKSGDKITDIEMKSLFEQLSRTENPYTCPHGRPTIIELSREDIEKEFKRIM